MFWIDLSLSGALQSFLGRWNEIWVKPITIECFGWICRVLLPSRPYCWLTAVAEHWNGSIMTDKCWSVWGTSSSLLGHTAIWRQLPTALYCCMLAFTIFAPLRNTAHTHVFFYRVALHTLTGQSSVSLYSKIHVKMSQNHKKWLLRTSNIMKTYRVRASSHWHPYMQFAMHHWFPRLRYADCEMGPYHRFLIFGNIYKNTEKHKEMPLPDLKFYEESPIMISGPTHRVAYMPSTKAPPLLKALIAISPRTRKFMRNNL